MRQTTWTHVYFIAQLFYFIALVRTALGQDRSETKKIRSWSWSTVTEIQQQSTNKRPHFMPATRARPGLANCRAAVKLFFSEFKNIFPEIEITHIFPEIEKYIRKSVMLTRTWDPRPRPRPRTQVTRSRPRPWGIKAKAKDFGPKAKAKDLRCQSQ